MCAFIDFIDFIDSFLCALFTDMTVLVLLDVDQFLFGAPFTPNKVFTFLKGGSRVGISFEIDTLSEFVLLAVNSFLANDVITPPSELACSRSLAFLMCSTTFSPAEALQKFSVLFSRFHRESLLLFPAFLCFTTFFRPLPNHMTAKSIFHI